MKKEKTEHRLFISIEIEQTVKELLQDWQQKITELCGTRGFRFLPEENMHLTLHFLGNTPQHRIPDLEEIISEACCDLSPAPFSINSSGSFSTRGVPRVIWAGIDDTEGLLKTIHHRLKNELQDQGFSVEKRKFIPHLTIAYVKNPPETILESMTKLIPELIVEPHKTQCSTVSLKQSILKAEGALHLPVFEYELH